MTAPVAILLACGVVLIFCDGAVPVLGAGVVIMATAVWAWRIACRESAGPS